MDTNNKISLADLLANQDDPTHQVQGTEFKTDPTPPQPSPSMIAEPQDETTEPQTISEPTPQPEAPKPAQLATTQDAPTQEADPTAYYKLLTEANTLRLPEGYEFDGTMEGLEKAFEDSKNYIQQSAMDNLLNNLDKDSVAFLKFKTTNPTASPQDFFKSYEPITYKEGIRLNNDSQREQVVKDYLSRTTAFSPDKINREIERYKANGELGIESDDALNYLIKDDQNRAQQFIQQQEEQAKQRYQQLSQWQNSIIEATSKVVPAKQRQNQLQAFMFNIIDRGGQKSTDFDAKMREVYKNPQHYAQLADLLMDYKSDEGFNFDRYKRQGASKSTSQFQQKLNDTLKSLNAPGSGTASGTKSKDKNLQSIPWEVLNQN